MNNRLAPDLQIDLRGTGRLDRRADVGADDDFGRGLRGGVDVVIPTALGAPGATRRIPDVHELLRVHALAREYEVHPEIVESLHAVARRNLELAGQQR